MKSSIRIDIDFETNEPVIEIICDKSSNDLRDKMLSRFLEMFGGDSSWAKFNFSSNYADTEGNRISKSYLRPIARNSFPEEGVAMLRQHKLNVERQVYGITAYPAGDKRGTLISEIIKVLGKY